jgi:hypothetical protein
MPRRRSPGRPSSERRRAVRRDILGSLALVVAIFVSILALPVGEVHASVCTAATRIVGHKVPCGLSALNITFDTDRRPFVFVSLRLL